MPEEPESPQLGGSLEGAGDVAVPTFTADNPDEKKIEASLDGAVFEGREWHLNPESLTAADAQHVLHQLEAIRPGILAEDEAVRHALAQLRQLMETSGSNDALVVALRHALRIIVARVDVSVAHYNALVEWAEKLVAHFNGVGQSAGEKGQVGEEEGVSEG